MKSFLAFFPAAFAALAAAAAENYHALSDEFIEEINQAQDSWYTFV